MENVWAIIPALNEAGNIETVVNRLKSIDLKSKQIVVVDGGSSDNTVELANALGAKTVIEPQRGYGIACLQGLNFIRDNKESDDQVVLFVDADGSDCIQDGAQLVKLVASGEVDMALGSRLSRPEAAASVPPVSRWGNKFCCVIMNTLFGSKFTDLGPLRAISWRAIEGLAMADKTWGWTLEMQIKAASQGLRVQEIPVDYQEREFGESKISGSLIGAVKAGSKILYVLGRHVLAALLTRSKAKDLQASRQAG